MTVRSCANRLKSWQALLFYYAGAKRLDDGMVISVKWDDGFKASVPNDMLKAKEHCHLKLIEFYESKIKSVTRTKKTVDVTDAAPAEV